MPMPSGRELLEKLTHRLPRGSAQADLDEAEEDVKDVYKFLTANETRSHTEMTHQVLELYKDWWVSQSGMLAIAEDSRVEELNRCISRMFELGVPLALGEKRTPQFTLFQEIEIRGNKTECITAEELVGEGSPFLAVLAKSLAELYPQLTLDLFVLDGSGVSVQLGVQQTYLRLVWQNVIVDLARAQFILDLLVARLKASEKSLHDLLQKADGYHKGTAWKYCMPDYQPVVRMPCNDRVSEKPLPKLEQRPLRPCKIYQIRKVEGAYPDIQPFHEELSCAQWAELASIRQPLGSAVTEWKAPESRGEIPTPSRGGVPSGAAPARTGAPVNVRTPGGSPDFPAKKYPGNFSPQEPPKIYKRYFEGTCQEFRTRLASLLGATGTFYDFPEEQRLKWDNGSESIEFREINRTVTLRGKESVLRHILASVSGFCSAAPAASRGYGEDARASAAGSQASRASQVYAGTRPKATSLAALSTVAEPRSSERRAAMQVPYERQVCDVPSEDEEDEMKLHEGDIVTVTEDPGLESNNLERRVFGKNQRTGEEGWLHLGFTRAKAR